MDMLDRVIKEGETSDSEDELDFLLFRERPNKGMFPAAYTTSHITEKRFAAKYGHKIKKILYIQKSDRSRTVGIRKSDFKIIAKKMLDEVLKDHLYVSSIYQESDSSARQLLSFTLDNQDLSSKTNSELFYLYKRFGELYANFQFMNVPAWFILAEEFSNYLMDYLAENTDPKQAREALVILTTPTDPSYVRRQDLGLLNIIRKIQENKGLTDAFKQNKETPALQEISAKSAVYGDIQSHTEEFKWIPFDYIGPDLWDIGHFIKEITIFIQQGKRTEEEFEKLEKQDESLKRLQEDLKEQFDIDDSTYRLFKDMRLIMLMQDVKKEVSTKSHVWLQTQLLPEISKRINIEARLLRNLTEEEFSSLLLNNAKIDPVLLKKREGYAVLITEEGRFSVLLDEEAKDYDLKFLVSFSDLDIVKGNIASLGKARGKARVLLNANEISKVQEGDIIIATMTTPDYVPAMKKAVGIVTDEGGVTCHAAIVSRELGIPCIIATGIATKVFKDGEEIEVDAVHGIVKKIK
jgi:phosphohistidine swiveling domain-containing protein